MATNALIIPPIRSDPLDNDKWEAEIVSRMLIRNPVVQKTEGVNVAVS